MIRGMFGPLNVASVKLNIIIIIPISSSYRFASSDGLLVVLNFSPFSQNQLQKKNVLAWIKYVVYETDKMNLVMMNADIDCTVKSTK